MFKILWSVAFFVAVNTVADQHAAGDTAVGGRLLTEPIEINLLNSTFQDRMLQTVNKGACISGLSVIPGGTWTMTSRSYCPIYPSTGAVTWYGGSVTMTETYDLTCSSGYYFTGASRTATCTLQAVSALPSTNGNVAYCTFGPAGATYSARCLYDPVSGIYREAPLIPGGCSLSCSNQQVYGGTSIYDYGSYYSYFYYPGCDPGAVIRSVSITGLYHTYTGDLDIIFMRGGTSVTCFSRYGGSTDVYGDTWTFTDTGGSMAAAGYRSGTFACPTGASFATAFTRETGAFIVLFADRAGGDTGSYSAVYVTFENGAHSTYCPNGVTSCYAAGRPSVVSYPPSLSCTSCASRFTATAAATPTALSATQYSWSCNVGYYGAATTQVCNGDGSVSGAAPNCLLCSAALPPNDVNGIRVQTSTTTWRYSCPAGYFGGPIDYTCISSSTNGGYSASRLTCALCSAGYWCPGGDSGGSKTLCPAGVWNDGAAASSTSACRGPCTAGYYCPAGSTSSTALPCGNAGVYCPAGSATPVAVSAAYYTTPDTAPAALRTGQAPCPTGRQCAQGVVLASVDLTFCPLTLISVTAAEGVANQPIGPALTVNTPGYTGAMTYSFTRYINNDPSCASTAASFTVDTAAQKLKVVQALDYPTCLRGMQLALKVARADDATSFATCTVNVTLTQVAKTPVISSCSARTLDERTAVGAVFGAPLTATTSNVGTSLLWSVSSNPAFTIGMCDGQLRVTSVVRWRDSPSYTVTVTVVNDGSGIGIGTASATCTLTVNVRQVPRPPIPTVTSFSIAELSAVGTYVGNVLAQDPDGFAVQKYAWTTLDSPHAFNIDMQGAITVRQVVDSLAILKSIFSYYVNISNAYAWSTYGVTITLTPVPRPPVVMDQSRSIREDAGLGTLISPKLNASHPQNLNFAISVSPTTVFDCYSNGTVYLKAAGVLNYNTQNSYILTITVTDSRAATSNALLTISIIETNKSPYWMTSGWAFTVNEGAAPGDALTGTPAILANDPNLRDALTYSITSCTPALTYIPFAINPLTGAASVSTQVVGTLRYVETATYTAGAQTFRCTASVSDNGSPRMSVTGDFTVKITNIAPRLQSEVAFVIAGDAPAGTTVANLAPYAWTVYNINALTFSLASADSTLEGDNTFTISAQGMLKVANNSYGVNGWGGPRWNYNTRRRFTVLASLFDATTAKIVTANYYVNITHVNRAPQWLVLPSVAAPSRTLGFVGTRLSLYVTDLDFAIVNENHTFSIVAGNIQNTFAIRPWDGQLYVNNVNAPYFVFVKGAPAPVYNLTIRVCDAGIDGASLCTSTNCTVTVTETNFPPVVADQSFTLAENSPPGTVVGAIIATDPDPGQSLSYVLVSGNDGSFDLNTTTGKLTVVNSYNLDFEGPRQVYVLGIEVVDNGPGNLADSATIRITLTDVGENPTIAAVTLLTVNENSPVGTLVGSVVASDVDATDNGRLVYSIAPASIFVINPSTGAITVNQAVLDFETTSSYSVVVTVRDTYGLTASGSVQISIANRNDPPALGDIRASIAENLANTAIVTVVASDQDAGQALRYTLSRPTALCWAASIDTADAITWAPITLPTTPSLQEVVFRAASTGLVRIILRVSDSPIDRYEFSIGEIGSKASVRRCNAVCSSPIGGSVAVPALQAAVLSNWFVRVNRATGVLTLGIRSSNSVSATYTTLLTATDPSAALNVNEVGFTSSTAGARISSVCYEHASASVNGKVILDTVTGVLATAQGASFDFESQRAFGIEVQVVDLPGGQNLQPASLAEYGVVTLSVLDANERCIFPLTSCNGGMYVACLSIAENSPVATVVGNVVTAVDPDILANQVFSYSLELSNNTAGFQPIFAIGAVNARVSLSQPVLDFEAMPAYILTATATDSGIPALSCSGSVSVRVTDVNEAPFISAQSRSVYENSQVGATVVPAIVAGDPDLASTSWGRFTFSLIAAAGADTTTFAIDATTGMLSVRTATIDFETKNSYRVRVRVTDGGGLIADAWVDVDVLDVNEKPTLYPASRSISELVIGPSPASDFLQASDPDIGQTLSFSIVGGNGSARFRINRCSGQIELMPGMALDFETANRFSLLVMVEDDGAPRLNDSTTVMVIVLDGNEAPTAVDQSRTVPENSPVGAFVGMPFVVSDVDTFGGNRPWFTLTFSIMSGNDKGIFAINNASGQVTVAKSSSILLDFENPDASSFTLLIRAVDGGGLSTSAYLVVTVTDVNEYPIFQDTRIIRSIEENCPRSPRVAGDLVGLPATALDRDAGHTALLSYSILSGNDLGYFAITATGAAAGQLMLTSTGASRLNFEDIATFTLVISAQDPGRVLARPGDPLAALSNTTSVVINVININEAPVIVPMARFVWENATIRANVGARLTATDPENDILVFSILSGNTQDIFGIDASTGQLFIADNSRLDFETTSFFQLTVAVRDSGFPEGAAATLSSTAVVNVTVGDVNEPPQLQSATFNLPENGVPGIIVGNMRARWSDPDALDSPVFSIVHQDLTTSNETPFLINSTTGLLVVAAKTGGLPVNLDFEAKQTYRVVVRVMDKGGLYADSTVTVSLTNVNEPPSWRPIPVLYARALELQAVGQALIAYVVDQDRDFVGTGESLRFSWGVPSGNNETTFGIGSTDGQLSVINNATQSFRYPPGGPGPVYRLSAVVSDAGINGPVFSAQTTVFVEVTDNNYPPTIPSYTFYVSENTGVGTLVGTVLGSDRNGPEGQTCTYTLAAAGANINRPFPFSISTRSGTGNDNIGVGDLKVTWDSVAGSLPWGLLNFEGPAIGGFNRYDMTVTVTDSHPTRMTGSASVTIHLTDAPEAPYFHPTRNPGACNFTFNVPENSAIGKVLKLDSSKSCNPGSPEGGVYSYEDDYQQGHGNLTYSWKSGQPAAATSLFTVNSKTGVISVLASGLDYETRKNYTLVVTAKDTTGRTDEATVVIFIDDVNEAPVITGFNDASNATAASLAVSERAAVGTTIGRVLAADVDRGAWGTFAFSLIENEASAYFAVHPTTGFVTVIAQLDFEEASAFTAQVVVRDGGAPSLNGTTLLTIIVNDEFDAKITGFLVEDADVQRGVAASIRYSAFVLSHAAMDVLVQTNGGVKVTLVGTNLGCTANRLDAERLPMNSTRVTATYGPTGKEFVAKDCVVSTANTRITCMTAAGSGVNHIWTLNFTSSVPRGVGGVLQTVAMTGYLPPNITYASVWGTDPYNGALQTMPTDGTARLLINGTNFGSATSQVSLTYGLTGVELVSASCISVKEHTAVLCTAAEGIGRSLQFRVRVDAAPTQVSGVYASPSVRYANPVIFNISSPVLDTRGGDTISITGINFGPAATVSILAEYSTNFTHPDPIVYTASNCRVNASAPHRMLICQTAAGIGSGHRLRVSIGGQVSSMSSSQISYRSPIVLGLGGLGASLAITEGGQQVIIYGDQFGPVTAVDDNGIPILRLQPLARYGHYAQGTTPAALFYSALDCRVTVAHRQITCLTTAGTGKDLYWSVFVGDLTSGIFLNQSTNYHPPIVSYYSGAGSANANTVGGELVWVDGKNFGPAGGAVTATYGWNGRDFTASNCSVIVPHVRVACTTAVGAGKGHSWLLVIDSQVSVAPTTSYAAPVILGFESAWDVSTDGEDTVHIIGQYFSIQQHFDKVTYGVSGREHEARDCRVTQNHTRITCKTEPGTGRRLQWLVQVGQQVSRLSDIWTSYAVPSISTVHPANALTAGGSRARIYGRNFALRYAEATIQIRINARGLSLPSAAEMEAYWRSTRDGTAMEGAVSRWIASLESPAWTVVSDSRDNQTLEFMVPSGFGAARELFVVVDGVPSDITYFSYDAPRIVNVSPDRIGVQPGYLRVFVEGTSFCDGTNNCGAVFVGADRVTPTNYSHNVIVFAVPVPASPLTVRVEVGGRSSNTFNFRAPVPNFQALQGQGTWNNMNTAGGENFYIASVSDVGGVPIESLHIFIGGAECLGLTRTQDGDNCAAQGIPADSPAAVNCRTFRMSCSTPAGVGRGLPVIIGVPGGQSRADSDFLFSYAPPTIEDILDAASGISYMRTDTSGKIINGIPTTGRDVLVRGRNFGSSDLQASNPLVTTGLSIASVLSHNHTHMQIHINAGAGAGNRLLILVAGQTSDEGSVALSTPPVFRYAYPSIAAIAPQRVATMGGAMVTITGTNFGPFPGNTTGSLSTMVWVNGKACPLNPASVATANHDSIRCMLPAGQGANLTVAMSVAGQFATLSSAAYSYASPRVYAISPITGPTSGKTRTGRSINMTVSGENLGLSASVHFISTVFGEEQQITVPRSAILYQNHTHLVFPMPEGAGEHLQVVVDVSGQRSEDMVLFDYLPPVVTAFSRDDKGAGECRGFTEHITLLDGRVMNRTRPAGCYPTRGEFQLSIYGESFSMYTGQVYVGDRPCYVLQWEHSKIVCTAPQGYGDRVPVTVFVGARTTTNTSSVYFAYDAPIIESFLPNVPDASGQKVTIKGSNFGFEATTLDIMVGGLPCRDAEWLNDNTLSCVTPRDTVGAKNVSILVAGRSEPFVWYDAEEKIVYMCAKDWTGIVDEVCIDCDKELPGAVCPGFELYRDMIYSQTGWWRINATSPDARCHPLRQTREECPVFLPCEPKDSCTGNNKCSEGYTDIRCSQCLKGKYYRLNGLCVKCPNSPWTIAILFGLAGILACVVGFVLNKKNVSLTLIAVFVDYAQVLSMFARTRIRWPDAIKDIFNLLSAFNFNIDIAAPECAIPNVTFSMKWFFIEALPLFAFLVFLVIYTFQYLYKRCCTNLGKARMHSHLPQLVSTVIVMFRILYLYLTRMTLDVFNCSPTDPPDGKTYMSGMLEIVCWESGSTQIFLLPFAIVTLCLYTLGLPVAAFWFLYRRRMSVTYDQILKAQGTGNDSWTNPQNFMFRRMWRNLYQHFIPDKWYWELVIIGRKAFIVFVSLMFRRSPSYQLSVCLLILFAAFALQVRHTPYMTYTAAMRVVDEHHAKILTDPMHGSIASEMRAVAKKNKLNATKKTANIEQVMARVKQPLIGRVMIGLLDYNSVESVLLACAILVNVAGIMFDSNRFNGATASYYKSEYDVLAYSTILLIAFSLIYFAIAFAYDLLVICSPRRAEELVNACCSRCQRKETLADRKASSGALKAKSSASALVGDETHAGSELNNNPMLLMSAASGAADFDPTAIEHMTAPPDPVTWSHIRRTYASMSANLARLTDELRHTQKLVHQNDAESADAGRRVQALSKPARQQFKPTLSTDDGAHHAGALPRTFSASVAAGRVVRNPLDAFRGAAADATLRSARRKPSMRPIPLVNAEDADPAPRRE